MLEVKVKRALKGFDLDVAFEVNQEILSILGPSGSGKTMTLMCIAGLTHPDAGNIRLNGRVLFDSENGICLPARMRRIGFVFQFFNLIPRITARENVELSMSITGVAKNERRRRAEEVLDTVGLKQRMNHKPTELSGGEQQRVAIARALANDPKFFLMDEPTGNIDSKNASEIIELVKKLNEQRSVTIIMVTHDQNLAMQTKRILKMFDGTIVKEIVT